ncbi:MAG: helix-turn-helix domain-containing protein [Clostridia bacterium]|nr:helix-turn-helix domain-containing protein [Clostridia bacterium]
MKAVAYDFQNSSYGVPQNYIFQFVKDRKLTAVYHLHDFYELIWFLKGSGTQLLNEKEVLCIKNEIVMLRPGDRHCFTDQSEDIEIISLSVKKEEFELFSRAYSPFLLKHIDRASAPIRFNSLRALMIDIFFKAPQEITDYDCKLLLSCFLNTYITATDFLKRDSSLPRMLVLAIEEMKKAENLKRGIPAFIELSHYSQSQLSRLIKRYYGMSTKQYINELRLQAAYNDIILTNGSVEEIAENLGFLSFSHFNKIFKARFSITPAALRKSNSIWTI